MVNQMITISITNSRVNLFGWERIVHVGAVRGVGATPFQTFLQRPVRAKARISTYGQQ